MVVWEKVGEIVGRLGGKVQFFTRYGMKEGEMPGVQRSPADDVWLFLSIEEIAQQRTANGGHVDADLMGASGGQFQRQERAISALFQHLKIGQRRRAVGTNFPLQNTVFFTCDGGVYEMLYQWRETVAIRCIYP